LQHPFIARSPSTSCSAARRARSRSSTAPWQQRSVSACGCGSPVYCSGFLGQAAAVWAAKRDPKFFDVVRRHLRIPGHLSV
jgi:hypothetical protein